METTLGIRLPKKPDGSVVLRCERPDGTSTWRRCTGRNAPYFAVHDLTHHAVETTLGLRRGFYGLVAEGWDISDFGTRSQRGPLPPEAELAEVLVGFLSGELTSGTPETADERRAKLAMHFAGREVPLLETLDDEALASMGREAGRLRDCWFLLPPDGTIELPFPLLEPMP